jgi:hypothetical protein
MGHYSMNDFVGTRTRYQRFSDSKLFHGWVEGFTLTSIVVRTATDSWIKKADRFIFHVGSNHANATFVADFQAIEGLELVRTQSLPVSGDVPASLVEVPEANFSFRLVSQLEYQAPTEEARHNVGGWVVKVKGPSGSFCSAYLSDVSETGAGILCGESYQRGDRITIYVEALDRCLELEAEVRYSVRSKIAPDMIKTGLKLCEFGRLEGAVWRNFLKAA